MTRMVLATGDLSPALAELKHWLGITRTVDDAQLTALIGAGVEACEAFTGLTPLAATIEETRDASHEWTRLVTRPIAQVTSVELTDAEASRTALADDEYDLHLSGDGSAQLGVARQRRHLILRGDRTTRRASALDTAGDGAPSGGCPRARLPRSG
mgnify:CR=1 FL=1